MAKTCPKCDIQLQEGFLLSRTRKERIAADWVDGKPVRSFWRGLNLSGRTRLPVASWRCPRCGFLELHAPATGEADR
jgi:hypothetical protein